MYLELQMNCDNKFIFKEIEPDSYKTKVYELKLVKNALSSYLKEIIVSIQSQMFLLIIVINS